MMGIHRRHRNYDRMPCMVYNLTRDEQLRALRMWRSGNDTNQIAKWFNCPESLIYNKLPTWRRIYRGAA